MQSSSRRSPSWTPQAGPQSAFVLSPHFEVVYGGARGGGKTDGSLGDFARHAKRYGPDARGLLVRRKRVALNPAIARAEEIFGPEGARWIASRSCFEWPNGARLAFGHLDRDADAELYQGHAYTRVYVEELTQFPNPRAIDKLKATLRSAAGIPCSLRGTCNPGGPGHAWVKARYIDGGPRRVIWETFVNPFDGSETRLSRFFVPARLTDNPLLLERDPTYVARLQQSGSEALVRAWLEGDWNIVEGAFFDRWSERNIIRPFAIPAHWTRFRSFDWGYQRPFSVGWWAVASESVTIDGKHAPRGALIRYREWYGSEGDSENSRLHAEEVALGILRRDGGETIAFGVADPSIFAENGGPSIGERMRRAGVALRPADNTRVGRLGALSGWDQMRARIAGDAEGPMLLVFSTCADFLRTVPALQHDPDRPEDLDTKAEDHVADETRYACLARPLTAPLPPPVRPRDAWDLGRQSLVNDWKTM